MTAIDGDWAGALGALVLFATNLLAMIVVGAALFSSLAAVREHEATRSPAPAGLRRRSRRRLSGMTARARA